jgi:putative transposase
VLARVSKKRHDKGRKALHRIFYAACPDDARDEARQFLSRYSRGLPTACETLARHLEECLTFYRFPERHWRHIRTSNVIERSFKEVKRRTRVVGRFPNETSALVMVFSLLEEERTKWQKVGMRADDIAWIEEASRALEQEPIRLEFLEEALVA